MIAVLFTKSYPYDFAAEQTFLQIECEYLVKTFEQVIIVPERCEGRREPVPPGIEVEEGFAATLQASTSGILKRVQRAFSSGLFYQEVMARPSIVFQPASLKRLLGFVDRTLLAREWVDLFIGSRQLDSSRSIFYTYWFDASTLGIGLAKENNPELMLVSRTHRYDLYEEPYIPCRAQSLQTLDRLFPDSASGTSYLVERYPRFAPLCETSLMGVRDPGFVTAPSQDGVFRIVSCSYFVPVKRVDLLLRGLACAAQMRPQQQFEWCHIGDGPLKDAVEDAVQRAAVANFKSTFPGLLSFEQLMSYYKDHEIDLFINVSASEGTPVSLMEAISCGIPVVATAVGGNREIVSDENGLLLGPDPGPEEIAAAILKLAENPELAAGKRMGTRQVWQRKYDADTNYREFAGRLKSIREQAASGATETAGRKGV